MYKITGYDSAFFATTLFTHLYVMILLVENTRSHHSTKRRGLGSSNLFNIRHFLLRWLDQSRWMSGYVNMC